MNQIKSSVLASRATTMITAAKFAHLLSDVLLLPETGIFNAATLVAMKENGVELTITVSTAGSVVIWAVDAKNQNLTMYDMGWLRSAFIAEEHSEIDQFVELIDQAARHWDLPFISFCEQEFEALTRSKSKEEGVLLDPEEFLEAGFVDGTTFLRIDVMYPDTYEGKKEEEVQA